MRAVVVHNPSSGNQAENRESLTKALRKAGFQPFYVSSKDDGMTEALRRDADLVIIAGGDGTVGEVLLKMPRRSIPVALLPLGKANNIAHAHGIAGGVRELVRALRLDLTRDFHVGKITGLKQKRFAEAFGVGAIASLLLAAEKKKKLRKGSVNRGRRSLRKLVKMEKPFRFRCVADGHEIAGEALAVEISTIPYAGPALPLAPAASPSDGTLELVILAPEQRKAFMDWIERPDGSAPPLTTIRADSIALNWEDAAYRIDDEAFVAPAKGKVTLSSDPRPFRVLVPHAPEATVKATSRPQQRPIKEPAADCAQESA